MMPGARSFLLLHVQSFIYLARWDGRERLLQPVFSRIYSPLSAGGEGSGAGTGVAAGTVASLGGASSVARVSSPPQAIGKRIEDAASNNDRARV